MKGDYCMNKNINLVVNTLIKYDNKDNLSWMMVYKSILKELNLDNMISNSIFLRDVVKKISRDGYDIYDNPFKLVRYK
jgi:L-fucose mutarotase/ribose pyranase (RbsD/FucU family)